MLTRNHGNDLPIHDFQLLNDCKHCILADLKCIKVWSRQNGSNSAVIEPDADVHHVYLVRTSVVVCAAVKAPKVKYVYIPLLKSAPRWCTFLDTFMEELGGDRGLRRSDIVVFDARGSKHSGADSFWSSSSAEEEEHEAKNNDDELKVISRDKTRAQRLLQRLR